MGPVGRTSLIGRSPDLFLIDLQYIPLLPSCSSPRYQHNIPYTKIRGFGMRTSGFRISEYQQCAFSFEVSHEPRNAHFGRDTDQNMYMIRTHFSFDYLHAFPLT